jgi:4-methylaminobutanoate oxidase (formaldehyde-forming)
MQNPVSPCQGRLEGCGARLEVRDYQRLNVSNAALPYMTAKTINIRSANVLAQRVTYVGELGWELYMGPAWATQVWGAVMAANKKHGIVPCGYKVLESLRLEKGYRYFSADVTMLENPYEAGLGFCVRLKKGDFIG